MTTLAQHAIPIGEVLTTAENNDLYVSGYHVYIPNYRSLQHLHLHVEECYSLSEADESVIDIIIETLHRWEKELSSPSLKLYGRKPEVRGDTLSYQVTLVGFLDDRIPWAETLENLGTYMALIAETLVGVKDLSPLRSCP